MHIQASSNPKTDHKLIELIKQSPEFYACQWNTMLNDFPDKQIYPSKSMILEIKQKILEGLYSQITAFQTHLYIDNIVNYVILNIDFFVRI
jgi:hypothetical protein